MKPREGGKQIPCSGRHYFRYATDTNCHQHVGYSRTDLVILNRGKKARTTPKPAPSCPRFCQTSGRTFGPDGFSVHQARLYGGSSMEQGLELGALRYRSRYFTTRSSRFPQIAKKPCPVQWLVRLPPNSMNAGSIPDSEEFEVLSQSATKSIDKLLLSAISGKVNALSFFSLHCKRSGIIRIDWQKRKRLHWILSSGPSAGQRAVQNIPQISDNREKNRYFRPQNRSAERGKPSNKFPN
ncbi:hypothetical protein AVEN_24159-1 [Araneus ventricosus]|uniref:Uncharacterized protein n=1 Tax=Araneus ventricosus TaxID=182803 RepID=A0A4Y2PZ33_ARAVE|nr:hypothetical protein AVEN_24159-1 [Araneus ventricosus]